MIYDEIFEPGRIGRDDLGVRFLVLVPGSVHGSYSDDDPNYVAVLPGGKLAPGAVVHISWLEGPISWEEQ